MGTKTSISVEIKIVKTSALLQVRSTNGCDYDAKKKIHEKNFPFEKKKKNLQKMKINKVKCILRRYFNAAIQV